MKIHDMPHGQKFTHQSTPGTVWQKVHSDLGRCDGINYVILVLESPNYPHMSLPALTATDVTMRHCLSEYEPINWK